MFGVFGRNIPTAHSLLSPFNIAGAFMDTSMYKPYSYIFPPAPSTTATTPVAPVAPDTTHYADYRTILPAWSPPKINIPTGINPGFVGPNRVTTPITSPTQNQFNWGYSAGPAVSPVIPAAPKINFAK